MIGGVTKEVAGASYTLRLTTRAMMAVEDKTGKGIVETVQELSDGFRVSTVAVLLCECMNDGNGATMDDAQLFMDAAGITGAGEILGEVVEAAFPDAKGKNQKGQVKAA